jgi:hypothetical protein
VTAFDYPDLNSPMPLTANDLCTSHGLFVPNCCGDHVSRDTALLERELTIDTFSLKDD